MWRYVFKRGLHLNLKIIFINSILLFCVSSCVFLPETAVEQKYYNQCEMATKNLTLNADISKKYTMCGGQDLKEEPLICLVASGVVGAASLVVSGSIVLIGNSIHWIEYKTSC
jgi:hypothetical protein